MQTDVVPANFYEYKYLVTFADGRAPRIVTDPCTRYGGISDQNAAVAIGGSRLADTPVHPLAGGRRPLAELNIYELMMDDFTAEYRGPDAPMAAVIKRLDAIGSLGSNAIVFMPWTAWGSDTFNWGYTPFQFFSIEPRYADEWGQPAEKLSQMRRLINECHGWRRRAWLGWC